MSFFDQNNQREIYRLLKIDHSIDEINKRIFAEDNRHFFHVKEKYKDKQKGLALKDNARIQKFLEVNKDKPKQVDGPLPKKQEKRPLPKMDEITIDDKYFGNLKKRIKLL